MLAKPDSLDSFRRSLAGLSLDGNGSNKPSLTLRPPNSDIPPSPGQGAPAIPQLPWLDSRASADPVPLPCLASRALSPINRSPRARLPDNGLLAPWARPKILKSISTLSSPVSPSPQSSTAFLGPLSLRPNAPNTICQSPSWAAEEHDDDHHQAEPPGTNHKKRKVPSLSTVLHSGLSIPSQRLDPRRSQYQPDSDRRAALGEGNPSARLPGGEYDDRDPEQDLPGEDGHGVVVDSEDEDESDSDGGPFSSLGPWSGSSQLDYKDPLVLLKGLCSYHVKMRKKSINSPTHYGRHLHKLMLARLISPHLTNQVSPPIPYPVSAAAPRRAGPIVGTSQNPSASPSGSTRRNAKRKVPSQALLLKHRSASAQKTPPAPVVAPQSTSVLKMPILPNLFDPKLGTDFKHPKVLNELELVRSRMSVTRRQWCHPWVPSLHSHFATNPTLRRFDGRQFRVQPKTDGVFGNISISSEFSFRMELSSVNRRLEILHQVIREERHLRESQIKEAVRIAMEQEKGKNNVAVDPVGFTQSAADPLEDATKTGDLAKSAPIAADHLESGPVSNQSNPPTFQHQSPVDHSEPSGPPPTEPPPPLPASQAVAANSHPEVDSPNGISKKNKKGKKKRSAHANANNIHHRDNYVPSRLPSSSSHFHLRQNEHILDELSQIKSNLNESSKNSSCKASLNDGGARPENEDLFSGLDSDQPLSFEDLIQLNRRRQRGTRCNTTMRSGFIDPNLSFSPECDGDRRGAEDGAVSRFKDRKERMVNHLQQTSSRQVNSGSRTRVENSSPTPSSLQDDSLDSRRRSAPKTGSVTSATANYRHSQLGRSIIAKFLVEPDEWICSFCEYELWFGHPLHLDLIIKKRKQILKRRKKIRERALNHHRPAHHNNGAPKNNSSSVK